MGDTLTIVLIIPVCLSCIASIVSIGKEMFGVFICAMATFMLSSFCMGLNLLIRLSLDLCDFDPDEVCGVGTQNRGAYSGDQTAPQSEIKYGKGCSNQCREMEVFGWGMLSICLCPVFVYCCGILTKWLRNENRTESNGKGTKIGCECCYCTV